jgi:hypothetical protein
MYRNKCRGVELQAATDRSPPIIVAVPFDISTSVNWLVFHANQLEDDHLLALFPSCRAIIRFRQLQV